MKCIQKWILSEPLIDPIDHHDILSSTEKFYEIDIEKVTKTELDFQNKFKLNITISGKVYGLVTWFDCYFSHGHKKYTLSTSPYKKSTHWKHTIFYVEKPFSVDEEDKIECCIKVDKADENIRELNVVLELEKKAVVHDPSQESKWKQYYRIS